MSVTESYRDNTRVRKARVSARRFCRALMPKRTSGATAMQELSTALGENAQRERTKETGARAFAIGVARATPEGVAGVAPLAGDHLAHRLAASRAHGRISSSRAIYFARQRLDVQGPETALRVKRF